jgi:hypothetical protein
MTEEQFMDSLLPEENLNELLPGLKRLAEIISGGETLDRKAFRSIVSEIGIDGEEWAFVELELWSQILIKCKDNSYHKNTIETELQNRGVPKASAELACYLAKPKPMKVDFPHVDFGNLKIGEKPEPRTLIVTGERVIKALCGPRIKVTLLDSGLAKTLVRIQLLGENAGESIKDEITLKGSSSEIRIFVAAQWEAEPSLLSWCPDCGDKIKKKSLFFNKSASKYECLNLACKHEFPYPDKHVSEYNNSHK